MIQQLRKWFSFESTLQQTSAWLLSSVKNQIKIHAARKKSVEGWLYTVYDAKSWYNVYKGWVENHWNHNVTYHCVAYYTLRSLK